MIILFFFLIVVVLLCVSLRLHPVTPSLCCLSTCVCTFPALCHHYQSIGAPSVAPLTLSSWSFSPPLLSSGAGVIVDAIGELSVSPGE